MVEKCLDGFLGSMALAVVEMGDFGLAEVVAVVAVRTWCSACWLRTYVA